MTDPSRRSTGPASVRGPRPQLPRARMHGSVRGLVIGAVCASALGLAACAVELTNLQPAQQLAEQAKPPGSVYIGWRVFQDKCAGCHGGDATGTAGGADLLPRVRDMGLRRFVGLVLTRYDMNLPLAPTAMDAAAREALIDDVAQRRQGALTMPPWQGEPQVNAHVVDLFAYVSARAQGTQGPGRPAP